MLKVYAVLLALAQFYAPSIPNLFRKLVPLYDMIKGKRSLQSLLKWTPELVKSFEGAVASPRREPGPCSRAN